MSKVLVLTTLPNRGISKAMANAVRRARRAGGLRGRNQSACPSWCPEEIARKSHFKLDQAVADRKIEESGRLRCDHLIGCRHPFWPVSSQMAISSTRPAVFGRAAALHGKVGGRIYVVRTQHGGQETTLFSIITNS